MSDSSKGPVQFASFKAFYPFYLGEHSRRATRRLHLIGSSCVIGLIVAAIVTHIWWLFALTLVAGYGFAWVAHFFVEKNRPATFRHPLYSFMGDWVMFAQALSGRIRW
ncbi:MAG: Mpo1-like protein [Gammaproteobacteria bacterium]